MYKDTFGYFGQSEFRQMLIHNLPVEKFKKILLIVPFSFFTIFLTILFWPFLWDDPSRIFEVLKSMSKFEWIGEVFFNGKY